MLNGIRSKGMEHIADISILGIALIWGSTFIIVKQAVESVPTFSFLSLRFGLAAIVLIVISSYKWKLYNRQMFIDGIILGLSLFGIFAFQTLSLKYTSASITGFLTGLYVIFAPILSIVFLKKYPHLFSAIGVVLAFVGLVFIAFVDIQSFSIGEAFGIVNGFFIGVHILLTDQYSRKHDAILLTTLQITVVAILSVIVSQATEPYTIPENFDNYLVFAIVGTGLFATVLAFFIQTAMQKYTTPTKAAIMFTMEPVSAAFFSFIIGGEVLMFKQYMGAALIVAAMVVAEVGTFIKLRHQNEL